MVCLLSVQHVKHFALNIMVDRITSPAYYHHLELFPETDVLFKHSDLHVPTLPKKSELAMISHFLRCYYNIFFSHAPLKGVRLKWKLPQLEEGR